MRFLRQKSKPLRSHLIFLGLATVAIVAIVVGVPLATKSAQGEASCLDGFNSYHNTVYPFLSKACTECHGGDHYLAPFHTGKDEFASYQKAKSLMNFDQNWIGKSRMVTVGGNGHCLREGGQAGCGASEKQLIEVLKTWVATEQENCSVQKQIPSTTAAERREANRATTESQVSNNEFGSDTPLSREILPPERRIVSVRAGAQVTCALYQDGELRCFGLNHSGQLGIKASSANGHRVVSSESRNRPNEVFEFSRGEAVVDFAIGYGFTCVLFASGEAECIGDYSRTFGIEINDADEASDVGYTRHVPHVRVLHPSDEKIIALSAEYRTLCLIFSSNSVRCLGWKDDRGAGEVSVRQLGPLVAPKSADRNALAKQDEALRKLGLLTLPKDEIPIQLSAKHRFGCVLFKSGRASCWGNNLAGQLGYVGPDQSERILSRYVEIPGGEQLTQISAGHVHACGVAKSRRLFCWGLNYYGALGADKLFRSPEVVREAQILFPQGSRSEADAYWAAFNQITINDAKQSQPMELLRFPPTEVKFPNREEVSMVSAGGSQTCALLTNGVVRCWGQNSSDQLRTGNIGALGTTTGSVANHSKVELPGGRKAIGLSSQFSRNMCAVFSDGEAACWSDNQFGELGIGTRLNGDTATFAGGGRIDIGFKLILPPGPKQ